MRNFQGNRTISTRSRWYFGTLVRRLATLATFVAIPCFAQPPGVIYSTTVPYTIPPGTPEGPGLGPGLPYVSAVAVDSAGNAYITGSVDVTGYPSTPGVVQPANAGGLCDSKFDQFCDDAFIAKFDSNGKLLFLTYLGGTGGDAPLSIAADSSGDVYVAGITSSTDFPLAGSPYRPALTGQASFITKLSSDGKRLMWSTVVNGNLGQAAVGPDGSLYYTTNTPDAGTLTKLNSDGKFVATMNLPRSIEALAIGADGSPVATFNGPSVAKIKADLSSISWQTLVGTGMDFAQSLATAPDGSVWVSGLTFSTNFPVLPGALQPEANPGTNPSDLSGFLVHVSANGSKALSSTYLPNAISLALDQAGNVVFSGGSEPVGFAATPGAQWPCPQDASFDEVGRGAIGKIDAAGQRLLWATESGPFVPMGPVAVDKSGNAIVANLVISALHTASGPLRLVNSCIRQAGAPYQLGPLAPGEAVSIYGAGFGPSQGVGAQPSGHEFPTELGGVQVFIEDVAVPLLYVSAAQINLLTPYLLDGRHAAHVRIVSGSSTSNEVLLDVQPAAPEIFEIPPGDPNDPPAAAILNQDGTVNSRAHPAHVGDFVAMFVSGLGQTNPPAVDGTITQAAGGTPVLPITVQLSSSPGFVNASVTYAGNAPGLVSGVSQVNFQVPPLTHFGAGPYFAGIWLGAGSTQAETTAVIWFE
jgi:uncharacterized protein (TIGR03437 family)